MAEYIDREAAIEAIADRFEQIGDDIRAASIRSKMSILRGIPAADVKPVVHGRWESEEDTYFGFTDVEHRCSQCGKSYSGQGFCAFHFCPNCGARMDLI